MARNRGKQKTEGNSSSSSSSTKINGTTTKRTIRKHASSASGGEWNNLFTFYSVASLVILFCVLAYLVLHFDLVTLRSQRENAQTRASSNLNINNAQNSGNTKTVKKYNSDATKPSSSQNGSGKVSEKAKAKSVKSIGGWRLASEEVIKKYDSEICNIDRVTAGDMNAKIFEANYRFKKPLIVTFPKGANSWTDSQQWTVASLKKLYADWSVQYGNSLEIVRRGGNGDKQSSFTDFVDRVMRNDDLKQEPNYIFDRNFYNDSDLPKTLHPPKYFEIKNSLDDSIFFLGASGSGVCFHKHADAWNGVIFGRKRWFLYPTTFTPPGGVYPGFSQLEWIEKIYPRLDEATKPLECVQEAGEILYLPEGTYHGTVNLGDTVAIGIQKKEASTPTEKLFYEEQNVMKEIRSLGQEDESVQALKDKRINIYKKLHKLLPDNAEVYMKLGETYSQYGQEKRGSNVLQKAIDIDPYFVVALINKAGTMDKLDKPKEADTFYRRALELNDKLWDIHAQYGNFLMRQRRFADAVPHFKKGTELAPEQTAFWLYLQQAQQESGDKKAAMETALKLEELRKTKLNTRQSNIGKL